MRALVTIAAALLAAAPAFAETQATSGAQSAAVVSPGQINSPIVSLSNAAPSPVTAATVEHRTNQAATPGTVFVNPPSADVCARPGDGVAIGTAGLQIAATKGGTVYDRCDMRADAINLKVTGAAPEVIKARQCMDPMMEEAYARAGFPCTDARPPAPAAAAPSLSRSAAGGSPDPYIAMSGRPYPSAR